MRLISFGTRWINPDQIRLMSDTPEGGTAVVFEGGVRFECDESVEAIMSRIRGVDGPIGIRGPEGEEGPPGEPEPKAKK